MFVEKYLICFIPCMTQFSSKYTGTRISLSEANCDDQVRVARAKVPDHRVKPEECCPTCNSSVQEEVMAMLTNNIIPDVAKFLCTRCRAIIYFICDPLRGGQQ